MDLFFSFVSYVIRLASRIGGLVTLLRSKVSTVHVVQGHDDVMCAVADRCGTFTLPLPLPFTFTLLWTDGLR